MRRRLRHLYVVVVFHSIMFPRFLWRRGRCKIRRHHAEPMLMGKAPVRARNTKKRRVEIASKAVCSECFAPLGITTNRAWRRAAIKKL